MSQFRIGLLHLHIEIGRLRDKRICNWWRMNYIFYVFVPPTLTTGKTCIQLV